MHIPQHSTPAGCEGTSACAFLWLFALLAPAPWFPICQYQPGMGFRDVSGRIYRKPWCLSSVTDGIGAMLLGAFDRS